MAPNSVKPSLLNIPDVALCHLIEFLPQTDRKSLGLANKRLNFLCRLVSRNSINPAFINVDHKWNCCRTLHQLCEDITNGLNFEGLAGIRMTLQPYGVGSHCTRIQSSEDRMQIFSPFINMNLQFKHVYLDLQDSFFDKNFHMRCPLITVLRIWLAKQSKNIQTLCLRGDAIKWVVSRDEIPDMNINWQNLSFPNLTNLEVSREFPTKREYFKTLLEMSPNVKSLEVFGANDLQCEIPQDQINLVSWLFLHWRDRNLKEQDLKVLVQKRPALRRIDIGLNDEYSIMEPSIKRLIQSSTETLEQLNISSLAYLIFPMLEQFRPFPKTKILTLACNYNEISQNLSHFHRIPISSIFPNLSEIRILNSCELNPKIYERPTNPIVLNMKHYSVSSIGFDTVPSLELLTIIKNKFPSINKVCLRDGNKNQQIAATWKDLKYLEIYESEFSLKNMLFIADALGILLLELQNALEHTEQMRRLFLLTPIKPTLTDIFPEMKEITIICSGKAEDSLINILKSHLERNKTVHVNTKIVKYHEYLWK